MEQTLGLVHVELADRSRFELRLCNSLGIFLISICGWTPFYGLEIRHTQALELIEKTLYTKFTTHDSRLTRNMTPEAAVASFVAALFSMMNPIGNAGIFAGMTEGRSITEARHTAWACALAVAITLLVVTWAGSLVMRFFGVTVDTLRAAGGIVVLIIGLHMLFNKSQHKHTSGELEDAAQRTSIAVVPMAIPIVAGPGTMATVLVAVEHYHSLFSKVVISIVGVALAALTGLVFSFAGPISRRLGDSGMGVVTRVMGLVLAAIAMGMLAEGLKALLPGLA